MHLVLCPNSGIHFLGNKVGVNRGEQVSKGCCLDGRIGFAVLHGVLLPVFCLERSTDPCSEAGQTLPGPESGIRRPSVVELPLLSPTATRRPVDHF